MAACALIHRWAGIAFDVNGIRLDLEFLVCDEATNLQDFSGASVTFPVSATVSQIKSAIGAAVRSKVSSQFGLTIPSNEVIMPEISKV